MDYGYNLNGIPVYLNSALGAYKQRRTHKRRRINKKWAKRYGRVFVASKEIVLANVGQTGKMIVVHPDTWRIIEQTLEQRRSSYGGNHHIY